MPVGPWGAGLSVRAVGGNTGGGGLGERDSTGHLVAGVVHEGEWVAPE
ncbi:hypothetical protein [Hymenobacter nivis]|nr:hypothetical protein [Hymenobacter nivis]